MKTIYWTLLLIACISYAKTQEDEESTDSDSDQSVVAGAANSFMESLGMTFLDWLLKHGQKFVAKQTLEQQMKFLEVTDPEYAKSLKAYSPDQLAASAVANQAMASENMPSSGNKIVDLLERNGFPVSNAMEGLKELQKINEPPDENEEAKVAGQVVQGILQKILGAVGRGRRGPGSLSALYPNGGRPLRPLPLNSGGPLPGSVSDFNGAPNGVQQISHSAVPRRLLQRLQRHGVQFQNTGPGPQGSLSPSELARYQQNALINNQVKEQAILRHMQLQQNIERLRNRQDFEAQSHQEFEKNILSKLSPAQIEALLLPSERNQNTRSLKSRDIDLQNQLIDSQQRQQLAAERLRILSSVDPVLRPPNAQELSRLRILEEVKQRLRQLPEFQTERYLQAENFPVAAVLQHNFQAPVYGSAPLALGQPIQRPVILPNNPHLQFQRPSVFHTLPNRPGPRHQSPPGLTKYRFRNRVETTDQGPGAQLTIPSGIPHLSSVDGKFGSQIGRETEYDGEIRLPKDWLASPKIGATIRTKTRNSEGSIGGLGLPIIGDIG